jgi:hypothetical protein
MPVIPSFSCLPVLERGSSLVFGCDMVQTLATAGKLKADIRLAQAVSDFEADLLEDQKSKFKKNKFQSLSSLPKPQDVMHLTAEIDMTSAEGGRCFGPRLANLAQSVQQFAALGDIIIGGSQTLIACGVWTVFRMSLLVRNEPQT